MWIITTPRSLWVMLVMIAMMLLWQVGVQAAEDKPWMISGLTSPTKSFHKTTQPAFLIEGSNHLSLLGKTTKTHLTTVSRPIQISLWVSMTGKMW